MDLRTARRVASLRRLAEHPHTEAPLRASALAKIAELEAKHPDPPLSDVLSGTNNWTSSSSTREYNQYDDFEELLRRRRGVPPRNGKYRDAAGHVRPVAGAAQRASDDFARAQRSFEELLRSIYGIPHGVDIGAPVKNGKVEEVDTDDGDVGHIRYDADPHRHVSYRYNSDGSVHVVFRTTIT